MEKSYLQLIREKFPHPIRECEVRPYRNHELYCVGGAVCQFNREQNPDDRFKASDFPDATELAGALLDLNPKLGDRSAITFAGEIIDTNDAGSFERAWQILSDALTFVSPGMNRRSSS